MLPKTPTYHSRRALYVIVPIIVVSIVIVALTLGVAMWNKGYFLPKWAHWQTYATETDINGNSHIEKVELMNRHLAIIDDSGNLIYTPNDLLISDFLIADIIRDDTPDVFALVWHLCPEGGDYHSPFLGGEMGFAQHLYIFDYEDGELTSIWTSEPLGLEAQSLGYVAPGRISITLSNGRRTYWVWDDDNFVLYDRELGTNPRAYID